MTVGYYSFTIQQKIGFSLKSGKPKILFSALKIYGWNKHMEF